MTQAGQMSKPTDSGDDGANSAIGDGQRRLVVGLLAVAALIVAAYWVVWFLVDRSALASSARPAYYEFENAFPLADGWLALCIVASIITLARRRPSALLWLLAGGGAGFYLATMDVLYDIEHRIWFAGGGGGLVELAINIITVAASVGALTWAWSKRNPLLAGQ
ncbi:MAG TPA: hypothetical protein VGS19_04080 [Streptosporangiaceae bacterium]|nr:hypothetical protein [Streptosporangiaceae bacterium]